MKRIAMLLAAACVACGGDHATTGTVSFTIGPDGTWALQTINGAALPVVRGSGSSAITIRSSTLTVSTDRTYREVTTITLANGQPSTTSEVGTWTETNAGVTFHDQSDNTEYPVGVGADGKLTKLPGADRDVYMRQ